MAHQILVCRIHHERTGQRGKARGGVSTRVMRFVNESANPVTRGSKPAPLPRIVVIKLGLWPSTTTVSPISTIRRLRPLVSPHPQNTRNPVTEGQVSGTEGKILRLVNGWLAHHLPEYRGKHLVEAGPSAFALADRSAGMLGLQRVAGGRAGLAGSRRCSRTSSDISHCACVPFLMASGMTGCLAELDRRIAARPNMNHQWRLWESCSLLALTGLLMPTGQRRGILPAIPGFIISPVLASRRVRKGGGRQASCRPRLSSFVLRSFTVRSTRLSFG